MMKHAKIGAVLFALWGLLHIVGGAAILLAALESPDQGFAYYRAPDASYSTLAGNVLAYLAFGFVWIGAVVSFVGIRYNFRNSYHGLMLNTALVGFTDLGLLLFLVMPGHLGWLDAAPGLLLFVGAALFGGMACRSTLGTGTTNNRGHAHE
ncbi:MAG TPA: hypothetical protein PKK10_15755 [Woeseiaceae bacterium]|nr:hypothetical protein [Woeseiaceae bacterium]